MSYAHADGERVRALVGAMPARGLRVWLDETEIADFAGITPAISQGAWRIREHERHRG